MSPMRCLSLVAAAVLAACAAPYPPPSSGGYPAATMGESEIRWGQIVRIDSVQIQGDHQLGVGAVLGGIAGGLLGHQVGGGHGRTVATVAGTLLGGYAGSQVQNNSQSQPGQHILVGLPSGVSVGITQPYDASLRVGDQVQIVGAGPGARVVRR